MGIGSDAWDRLFGDPRPAELHPFREFRAGSRHAIATPGDLLFHIRAKRMDLCFEMAAQIMGRLGDAVTGVDEVHGFRYFDDRDLLGFVDGTENPRGQAVIDAALIGAEDPAFSGGSYVITQKYLHDLAGWNALPTETQERIIGRTKLADIELDDSVKPTFAHNALTVISENGQEFQIVRDNMPFGKVGEGEYGTYFIGYCRTPRVTEQMIENMFIGKPTGNYDRLLDFSRAVTGTLFFVPSATFLDALGEEALRTQRRLRDNGCAVAVTTRRRMVRLESAPSKEKRAMNNLHRELAPISDAAWAQIEEETRRTLKRYLAGRRVVDVEGPGGAGLSAIGTGHLKPIAAPGEGSSRDSARSSLWSNSESPSSLTASRSTTSSGARTIPTGSRRRTPRRRSLMPRIAPSSKATRRLRLKASGRGRAIRS